MTDQKSLLEFLHGLNAILWESDAPTRQFTFVSQGAEKALGYPVHQWLREPDFWIQHIHPDDRECAITSCFRAVAEGRDNEFEYRMVAADGRPVWLRDIVRIVRDEGGVPVRLHGVMVDINQRKLTETKLAERTDLPAFFGPPITGEQRQSAWLSRSRVLLGQREPASPASAHRHPSQHGAAL